MLMVLTIVGSLAVIVGVALVELKLDRQARRNVTAQRFDWPR